VVGINPVRIVVDGYNLGLEKGTGIKTYGISLLQALEIANYSPSILFDFKLKKYGTIDDVLMYDANLKRPEDSSGRLKNVVRLARNAIIGSRVKKLTLADFAQIPERFNYLKQKTINPFVSPGWTSSAISLYKKLGLTPRFCFPEKVDIWHTTCPIPVRPGSKSRWVVTIHDLIPLKLPWTCLDDKYYFYKLVKDVINKSDLIMAVSEHTKQDILSLYDVNPDKIIVTYQAVPKWGGSASSITAGVGHFGLNAQNYLLFVGNIEPKKNVRRLINAYYKSNIEIPLVVVGSKAWMWDKQLDVIDRYKKANRHKFSLKKRVILLQYVSRSELYTLYQNASCLVFPSLYEGFGLPPLEAMTLGCPVITSNVSSLPEVCADAALYVDPYDESDIATKMQTVVEDLYSDQSLRRSMIEKGYKQAEYFALDNYAERLDKAYRSIL
jgi:glycosyltransferase involved in cell wall biosynthesis